MLLHRVPASSVSHFSTLTILFHSPICICTHRLCLEGFILPILVPVSYSTPSHTASLHPSEYWLFMQKVPPWRLPQGLLTLLQQSLPEYDALNIVPFVVNYPILFLICLTKFVELCLRTYCRLLHSEQIKCSPCSCGFAKIVSFYKLFISP